MSEDTILELQVKVAFFENTVAELDAVLRQLYARIEALETEFADLRSTMSQEHLSDGLVDNKPPHY
jgi:uncharacterized coiled-coil protein SlyX